VIVPLTAQDAERIEALAARFYPGEFALSAEEIAENLQLMEDQGCNFSFGLEDQHGALTGYWLAWAQSSRLEGREHEEVVLVDDVVLAPGARPRMLGLIEAMLAAMAGGERAGLPIEGVLRAATEETFTGHPGLFERLGYRQTGRHEYADAELGENLVWVRFETLT